MSAVGPEPTRRFVWCQAGGQILHGRTRPGPAPRASFWQRLLGRAPSGGTLYVFEPVDEAAALRALEQHLARPGAFALETAEGARIDFLGSGATLTLDCWFFECEEPPDCLVVARDVAASVVTAVFALERDSEVARRLLELAARRAEAA
jgi:hypothetical protein